MFENTIPEGVSYAVKKVMGEVIFGTELRLIKRFRDMAEKQDLPVLVLCGEDNSTVEIIVSGKTVVAIDSCFSSLEVSVFRDMDELRKLIEKKDYEVGLGDHQQACADCGHYDHGERYPSYRHDPEFSREKIDAFLAKVSVKKPQPW